MFGPLFLLYAVFALFLVFSPLAFAFWGKATPIDRIWSEIAFCILVGNIVLHALYRWPVGIRIAKGATLNYEIPFPLTCEGESMTEEEKLLAMLTAKIMVLENAVGLSLASNLAHLPDENSYLNAQLNVSGRRWRWWGFGSRRTWRQTFLQRYWILMWHIVVLQLRRLVPLRSD